MSVSLDECFKVLDGLLLFKEVKTPNKINKRNLYIKGVKLSHGKIIRYYHSEKTSEFFDSGGVDGIR